MNITVSSSAFKVNESIPRRHTEDGENLSPPLAWSGLPAGTKELVLIVDDPDAPTPEPWVHWVLHKVSASVSNLPEGVDARTKTGTPAGALHGKNSWGTVGYRGPAPPKGHGVHHYHFKLYALDTELHFSTGAEKKQVVQAIKGHILAEGELVGTYQR